MPQLEAYTYPSQFFWLITSFLCLWFFMSWFIIPKIEDIMEQRRRKIDDYVQKAEKINKQALASLNKYEKALQKAKQEAQEAINQNRINLENTVNDRRTEIENLLNQKIADTEFLLAKERQETINAIDEISLTIASKILDKIGVDGVDENALKNSAGDNK